MQNNLDLTIPSPTDLGVLDSTELLVYDMFYRRNILRRITEMGRLWDKSALQEYPVGCVLHLIDDNFLMNKPIQFIPDVKGWSISINPPLKFIYHVTDIVEGTAPIEERFVLPQPGLNATLLNFRRKHQQWIRPVLNLEDFPNRANTQPIISYNSLYRARIFGILRNHRRLKYILASVINTIQKLPDRKHFIPIPLTNTQYDRQMFLRTYSAYNKATIKFPDDMHYLFLMHFLGFVHAEKTESIFEYIPQAMLPNINFVLTAGNHMIIYNLGHLKEWNGNKDVLMVRLLKQLNTLAESGTTSTTADFNDAIICDHEVDETLPPVVDIPLDSDKPLPMVTIPMSKPPAPANSTNLQTTTPTKPEPIPLEPAVIPEPQKIAIKQAVNMLPIKPLLEGATTAKAVKDAEAAVMEFADFEPELLEIDDKWLTVEPDPIATNAPAFKKPLSNSVRTTRASKVISQIDTASKAAIERAQGLTKAQLERCQKNATLYKNITYNGKTVEKILSTVPEDKVDAVTLDFLADRVPDQSMLKSTVTNFDHEYISKMADKHLVEELTAFNQHGMFLLDIKKTDLSDSLNNIERVSVTYEDIRLKRHTVNFTLPKADDRGYFYLNGNYKVLKKQRIANPICKLSKKRVALSSDFNKYLVERNTSVAHSFICFIDTLFKKATPEQQLKLAFGGYDYQYRTLPYEYSALASKYRSIDFGRVGLSLLFDYEHRLEHPAAAVNPEQVQAYESDLKAVFFGGRFDAKKKTSLCCFLDLSGNVHIIDLVTGVKQQTTTIIDMFAEVLQQSPNQLSEWVDFKILNKSVPLSFALCYRYGLSEMLKYTKTRYTVVNKGERLSGELLPSAVVIRFADKRLIIPRSPLLNNFLFSGLNYYDLSKIDMDEMDSKDVYYSLIQARKLSVHNLKGIDSFFDMFVDPITKSVLEEMGEPTDPRDLLIRCVQLLTTEDHPDPSASTNFRFRSHERLNAAIYKTLARAHETYKYKAIGASHKFSIPEYEIQQLIMEDQLMENVSMINPIADISYQHTFSHTGFGGRSADTFMIGDRQYPLDGVGIVSEATSDSSKVGLNAVLSANPTIINLHGMTLSKQSEELDPAQVLSVTSMLMPSVTNDDGKRANFVNSQLSHYLPTKGMVPSRVRTGFEPVIAHRTKPPFAFAAEEDGDIIDIDENSKIVKLKYKSGKLVAVAYGEEYVNNGGGGFYTTQRQAINGFKTGDKVKRGDVVVYNEQFFTANPFDKQVDFNIGILTNVAIIDNDETLEDSSTVSPKIAELLEINPVHVRDIVLRFDTTVHEYASIGTLVKNTDPLLIFDQSEMPEGMFGSMNDEAVQLLAKLNRQTPKAKFSGKVVRIDTFFRCSPSDMSVGLRKIVKKSNVLKEAQAKAASDTISSNQYVKPGPVKSSDRIGMNNLDEETVIVRFYIQQATTMGGGDKVVFDSSLKSVSCRLMEETASTLDHSTEVDAIFSGRGINNRIILSPIITGIGNRVMAELEKQIVDLYFE